MLAGNALAGDCPPATVADAMGIPAGKYPQQYELAEFEQFAGCKLTFQENPAIAELNRRIVGNPALPPLTERLPEEPLVVAPYDRIGHYGGVLVAMSNAAEAGTSDFLSVRHVNLVRLSDDLQTIMPNVAKGWQWNDNFTVLTFFLRKGHKWSDGAPFTAEDVKFWYDDLALDPNLIPKAKDYVLVAGKRMQVEVIEPHIVKFVLPFPKPGLLSHFATSYAQGFQPKSFPRAVSPETQSRCGHAGSVAGLRERLRGGRRLLRQLGLDRHPFAVAGPSEQSGRDAQGGCADPGKPHLRQGQ